MFFVYLGLYLLFLLFIWGFFIVARIHAYKFKNFSKNISKFTNMLLFILIFLSLTGFAIIYMYSFGLTTYKIDLNAKDNLEKVYY